MFRYVSPMRPFAILCAVALLPVTSALAPSALAQVTVDLHALQALPQRPANPVVRLPRAAPNRGPVAPQAGQPASTASLGASPGTPPAPRASIETPPAPSPALPEQAPQTASVTPIEPPQAGAPPPPPPVSATAGTAAAPTSAGLRLTFTTGQSDLSPDSAASIKQFAAATGGTATFNVQAYAPGDKDDPSSARRLSLARAMAVRTALVADGVPSARIFVRALGAQYGSGPPDRVDIDMASDNAAAAR
ncbi:MAG TPA: OmpA family protein [Rhodopila sp.]|jgi:outer membrane protein OmpA-like peptidoglycan-associated protein|nr:OmpA family protein [Rhodopila sp.]